MSTGTGIYFDGQVACGRTVTLEFGDALRLNGEGIVAEFDLSAVRVSDRLGDVPRFIYLPGDAVVETVDNDLVDRALGERKRGRAAHLIHALESRQWIAIAGCFLLIAVIGTFAVYFPPILARVVARRVPPDIDQRIGDTALATIKPYFTDSSLTDADRRRVEKQLARLETDPTVPRPRLEFRSMIGGQANAFALPGNVIVVTDELVQLPATDDEIAAVLAHELGHLKERHGLQSLLRRSTVVLVVAAVTGDVSTLTSFAGTLPITILTTGYSRDFEREADRYALNLMRSRGIPPRAFVTVLVKLDASRTPLQRNATYLSTHPSTAERTALFGGATEAERQAMLAQAPLEQAVEEVKQYNFRAATACYDRALAWDPKPATYLLRFECHVRENQPTDAEADIAAALKLDPKYVPAYIARARFLTLQQKKHAEAIDAANTALRLDPKCGEAMATRGLAEMSKGDSAAAATDFDRATVLSPGDFHTWEYRARFEHREKKYAAALADYERTLKLAPAEQNARDGCGFARYALRDLAGAASDLRLVTDPMYKTSLFFLVRGYAERFTGNSDDAIADFGYALKRKPTEVQRHYLYFARGDAYLAAGNYTAAVIDYDELELETPKNGTVYERCALAHVRMGFATESVHDLAEAAKAGVSAREIVYLRTLLAFETGDYEPVIHDLDGLLEKQPDARTYGQRGLLEFGQSQWGKAEADFNAYLLRTKEAEQYEEFFRFLAHRARTGADQRRILSDAIAKWPEGWRRSIGEYLCGRKTEQQFLAETHEVGLPTPLERQCEAYFYIGMTHLLGGDETVGVENLKKCLRTGLFNFKEYELAEAQLRRLGKLR